MFQRLDGVLYIWGHLFIVYVTFIRLIVLYSRCRVNRSTNLSVVLYYVICFCFASTVRLGFHVAFPTCGVRPHNGCVHFTSQNLTKGSVIGNGTDMHTEHTASVAWKRGSSGMVDHPLQNSDATAVGRSR